MSRYRPRITEKSKADHRRQERERRQRKGEHVRALERARQPKRNVARANNPEQSRARWRAYRDRHIDKFKERDRVSGIRRHYGMTDHDYQKKLVAQNGVCAICRRVCKSGRALAVDHCHKSGRIRDLLCGGCNGGLGLFKDDPALLRLAAEYLEKHQ